MATDTPLLAEERDSDAQALLGGGHELEQSPLEELIAKSTSEQVAQSAPFFLEDEEQQQVMHGPSAGAGGADPSRLLEMAMQSSLTTLIGGILCLLQIGCVWASFLSESWFDTHLTLVSKDTVITDQILHSTTLASLLKSLTDSENGEAATFLVISSLIVPCLCMMLCPSWTMADHQERLSRMMLATAATTTTTAPPVFHRKSRECQAPRLVFEYLLRFSLVSFFILSIMDLGTSGIRLNQRTTETYITNRIKGGMVCYTLGMCFALGVVVVLRISRVSQDAEEGTPSTNQLLPEEPTTSNNGTVPRAPPNRAFQLPWRGGENDSAERQREQQRPLLQSDEMGETFGEASNDTFENSNMEGGYFCLSRCQQILVCEVGAIATCCWLPALFLPLYTVNYGGIAESFMDFDSFSIKLWEFPAVLWQRAMEAETDRWIVVSLGTVLLSTVYVLPILATLLCIGIWRGPSTTFRRFCRNVVFFIHPFLCGAVFALSLAAAIPAFEPLGEVVLNEGTSGFCEKIHQYTDASCLLIEGEQKLGLWFMLGQALALELFVLLSLYLNP